MKKTKTETEISFCERAIYSTLVEQKKKKLSKRANESYIVNDESTTTSEQASQYQLAKTLAQTAGDIKANI